MNFNQTLLAAAVTGIMAGVTACGSSTPPAASPDSTAMAAGDSAGAKHDCKGKNNCKGQGGCKTDAHSCKGMNDCKGQGGCKG